MRSLNALIISATRGLKKAAAPVVFLVFLVVRIAALLKPIPAIPGYGDAGYYISAGTAYVTGALPDSTNPEHPPLAKYIIGFFNVYLGNATLGSVVFGLLGAAAAFLISRKLNLNREWATVTVWLLAFDSVSISTAIYPVLDGFMISFAFLALFLFVIARRNYHYCLAGACLGAAVACKWDGVFFALPALAVTLTERKYLGAFLAVISAAGIYLLSYSRLLVTEGFGRFIHLQFWMAQYMWTSHGPTGNALGIIHRLLDPIIFNLTTYGRVSGYDPLLHPEAVRFLGGSYVSLAYSINPMVMLLLIPLLYWHVRNRTFTKDRSSQIIFWTLVSLVAWEILFVNPLELWFLAPVTSLISIAASPALNALTTREARYELAVCVYLGLVPIWLLLASAAIMLSISRY